MAVFFLREPHPPALLHKPHTQGGAGKQHGTAALMAPLVAKLHCMYDPCSSTSNVVANNTER